MIDTVIEPLLDAIAAALVLINGTGSFETTVKSVNEEPTNHATEITDLSPSLDVFLSRRAGNDGDGSPRPMFGAEVCEALIDIEGHVELTETLINGVAQRQKPHKAWLPLCRDVERVVKANRKWGNIAIKTELVDMTPEYSETDVAFTQQIRVQYVVPRA